MIRAPGEPEFVDVDPTRTFLPGPSFVRSMITLHAGEAPDAGVHVALDGRWNHGAEDKLDLILSPDNAKELGTLLLKAAKAARSDLRRYLAGER